MVIDKTKIKKRTIEFARMKMHDDGYWPFGCVIVKDGEVVGKGFMSSLRKLSAPVEDSAKGRRKRLPLELVV